MSNFIQDNDNDHIYKDPVKFIDTLDGSKHIVTLLRKSEIR